jgi:hypothetical protein
VNDVLTFLQSYGGVLSLLGSLVIVLLSTKFVTKVDHDRATESLDGKFNRAIDKADKIEDRVAALENEFRHLPDRGSVHTIQLSLSELRGEMRAMGEQLKPVAAISERLQEFLLEQARK